MAIGATTPSTGAFTILSTTGTATFHANPVITSTGIGYSGVPGGGNAVAFGWTSPNITMYVDGINVGNVAVQANYVAKTGDTMSGASRSIGVNEPVVSMLIHDSRC